MSLKDIWSRFAADRLVRALLNVAEEVANLRRAVVSLEAKMDVKFQALIDQVNASTSVEQSAVTLINGLSLRLGAALEKAKVAGATEDQLQAIVAETSALKSSADSLAAAVSANTPAVASDETAPATPSEPQQ